MANRDQQPPTSNPDDQLKHIAEVTKHARTAWFVLLGFLAFAGVTLLSVKDADFFSYGASTDMPLLGISIPTTYFFSVAPVLIAAFCIHLHLYLLKLWKAVAALPKTIDGRPIDDCVPPWLVTDWALWMRGLRNDAPLNAVSNIITFLLVWFGPLFVLTVFWWRVIPIRDKWLIFATGLFASVTIVIVIACFASALQTLSSVHKPTGENPRLHNRPMWWRLPRRAARLHIRFIRIARSVAQSVSPADYSIGLGLLIAFAMLIVSYDRLENEGRITRLGPASADLRGAELSIKPDDWQSYSDAKADFEAEYRRRLGITGRDAWQGEEEQEFNDTWARHRREYLSKIQSPSLSGRDLREARLEEAFIATVDLRGSRLEGANLYGAHLERADFYEARLQGAFLMAAHLEGANLQRARLERKFLVQAHLEGANLHRAHLEGAILGLTHLDGANLRGARLEGAILMLAHLEGANLDRAHLEGANLYGAHLERASFLEAHLEGAILFGADLTDAKNLTQNQLNGAIGDKRTKLPDGLTIPTCWLELPEWPELPDGMPRPKWWDTGVYEGRNLLCNAP